MMFYWRSPLSASVQLLSWNVWERWIVPKPYAQKSS
jgi:hypothetical protein